jgi:hypothetical protein
LVSPLIKSRSTLRRHRILENDTACRRGRDSDDPFSDGSGSANSGPSIAGPTFL